jgi:hypothetical protein
MWQFVGQTNADSVFFLSDRLTVASIWHDGDLRYLDAKTTSLTLALGRALARTWEPGDEVVCTRLDHDANVSSWMQAAGEAGATVRLVDFDPETGRLDPDAVAAVVGERTRLQRYGKCPSQRHQQEQAARRQAVPS